MKKNYFLFLFVVLLLTSCSKGQLLLGDELPLTTKSDYNVLSTIPEFDGVDFSKSEKKILKNGIMIELVDGLPIIDGDILLTEEDVKQLEEIKTVTTKAGVTQFNDIYPNSNAFATRWPNGIIPYVIESGHACRSQILTAMQEWSSKTSIKFVPYTNQRTYLFFMKDANRNASYVGYLLNPPNAPKQDIWILSDNSGVAMHEIGHAIGLIHEHQRSDAYKDIIVYENNIDSAWVQWFRPYPIYHDCLNRFNFKSIMLYSSRDCVIRGDYSMVRKEDGTPWYANRSYVSTLDIVAVEYYYNTLTPVYRYYSNLNPPNLNPPTDDHYYGLEAPQGATRMIKNKTYQYEYLEFYMPVNVSGTIPLKRYYKPSTLNHSFYPYPGYNLDTQVGYVFRNKRPGTVELREYKKVLQNSYHYVTTLSEEEYMSKYPPGHFQYVRTLGWVYPGRGDGRD